MPSTPSGYVLPAIYFAVPGTTIRAEQHNRPLEDLAAGVNDSVARDGSRPMTGNLPMAGRKITGLAAGTAAADAVRFDQLPRTSGWTRSLANLALTANQFPYATSPTAAAAANLTPFARTILDDANAASVRGTLGLGGLATADRISVPGGIIATGSPSASTFLRGDGSWSGDLGWGQTWQNVAGNRAGNTSYHNNTGRPIQVSIRGRAGSGGDVPFQVSTNNSSWVTINSFGNSNDEFVARIYAVIPVGHYYRAAGAISILQWAELR